MRVRAFIEKPLGRDNDVITVRGRRIRLRWRARVDMFDIILFLSGLVDTEDAWAWLGHDLYRSVEEVVALWCRCNGKRTRVREVKCEGGQQESVSFSSHRKRAR